MLKGRSTNLKWENIKMAELDLKKLITHFAHTNKAEGKSPRTVLWYNDMLSDYVKFLIATGETPTLSALNPLPVREFIVSQQDRQLSPFTVQAHVRALRAFSSWLHREDYTPENTLARLKVPKVPNNLVDPLSKEEIEKIIGCLNPLTATGSRDLAIITTFLDSGLRLSELCNLSLENAHIDDGYLKVVGKGNKERVVPLGASAQKVIWRYLFHFRPEPALTEQNNLFLTSDGQPLTPNATKLLIRRISLKAGVPRLHAHLCRHTYATSFLNQRCGDVFRLQQILGHTSLEMVRRYVHFTAAQDMMQGRVSSPLDQMGVKKLNSYKIDRA